MSITDTTKFQLPKRLRGQTQSVWYKNDKIKFIKIFHGFTVLTGMSTFSWL
jgi:hypothetical protein